MVPTNFQQKYVRVVHVQFVPRYVYICFLASNLLQQTVPVFSKKTGLSPQVTCVMFVCSTCMICAFSVLFNYVILIHPMRNGTYCGKVSSYHVLINWDRFKENVHGKSTAGIFDEKRKTTLSR